MSLPHSLLQTFAYKPAVDTYLQQFLKQQQIVFNNHSWSNLVFEKLSAFVVNGKSVRSTLLLRSAELFGYETVETLMPLAATIELLHSGILIQDDIMDKDGSRRGQPTIHTQLIKWAHLHQLNEVEHVGESLAGCAADCCLFGAMQLMGKLSLPSQNQGGVQQLVGEEFSRVALAQMNDIEYSYNQNQLPSTEEVLHLYQYKTGRYTISMPLMLAAVVTKQSQQTIDQLAAIGEEIGILFQLRDDYLNLYGTPETGKSLGSDLRENKKTLYRLLIEGAIEQNELPKDILEGDLSHILSELKKSSVSTQVEALITNRKKDCDKLIAAAAVPSELRQLLSDLTEYVSSRTR